MAIVTAESKRTDISDANLRQLDNVFNPGKAKKVEKVFAPAEIQSNSEIEIKTPKASAPKKQRKYTDTVVLNLPEGERSNFKAFCAKYNLTMTDFIYFSMDFVKERVEEGQYGLSRGGIKILKKDENSL